MTTTFYFYDLETTGFNARDGRIMQFAGQRTNMKLEPIGKPDNIFIKITPDVLPDPGAVLVTGITPQKTLTDGMSEAEFTKYFHQHIVQPGTIFVGFNNIRFDDEFIRHILYRNFYDPYEWSWQHNCSRWDLLDPTRMTRALRPDGIKWPVDSSGMPSNQLSLLTSMNKLAHANAHDALSDVQATIALAQLLKTKQPKLFNYLLEHRDKQGVAEVVNKNQPFIYTSGKYPSEYQKTTVVIKLAELPVQGAMVYDLRHDPTPFGQLTVNELIAAWQRRDATKGLMLPIKTLKYNRAPAVAPYAVLLEDKAAQQRLHLDPQKIEENLKKLCKLKGWPDKLLTALDSMIKAQQERLLPDIQDVDNQLYNGFFDTQDKRTMRLVRAAEPAALNQFTEKLKDKRLQALLPLYKARNFPQQLTAEETKSWNEYRYSRLASGGQNSRLAHYFAQIEELATLPHLSQNKQFLLKELKIYGESLLPANFKMLA